MTTDSGRDAETVSKVASCFLDGYGISQADFERMTPELESLLLLRAFDKLRWAIDRNAEELGGFVSHASEAVRRCLPRK